MAHFVGLCSVVCSVARPAWAEHPGPPPVVLARAPAAELPAVEIARRSVELGAEVGVGLPSCTDGAASTRRCSGLGAGPGLGVALLWRPSPYFALGALVRGAGFAFRPSAASELREASAAGYFVGALARVYFTEQGWLEPSLELGVGEAGLRTRAREADADYDETSSGVAFRAGGALEFYLSSHVRLGPALGVTRFHVNRLLRCGDLGCVGLDRASRTRGTGFSELSLRLTVVLGAAQ